MTLAWSVTIAIFDFSPPRKQCVTVIISNKRHARLEWVSDFFVPPQHRGNDTLLTSLSLLPPLVEIETSKWEIHAEKCLWLLVAPLRQSSHYQQLTYLVLSTGDEGSGVAEEAGSGNSKDGATVELNEVAWEQSEELRHSKTRTTANTTNSLQTLKYTVGIKSQHTPVKIFSYL